MKKLENEPLGPLKLKLSIRAAFLFLIVILPGVSGAAPSAELWPYWLTANQDNNKQIEHDLWQSFLTRNVIMDDSRSITLVKYGEVNGKERGLLADYLDYLQSIQITDYNRDEQLAYWVNLYNALTINVVLEHYPVSSILDIDISPGLFANGPWGAKLVTVEGQELSLDDIEHRILRPIWQDSRLHYVINCASIGCPLLSVHAYKADEIDSALDQAAQQFINSTHGVHFFDDGLVLSKIYTWFQEDFGKTERELLRHIERYADSQLAVKLKQFDGTINYAYDWRLNDAKLMKKIAQ